jgi:hypothetical protein
MTHHFSSSRFIGQSEAIRAKENQARRGAPSQQTGIAAEGIKERVHFDVLQNR